MKNLLRAHASNDESSVAFAVASERSRIAPPERRSSASKGFTLIELMITVAIVAILAAIAVTNYIKYAQISRRSDAYATLTQDQGILERCFALTFSYLNVQTGTNNCQTIPSTSPQGFYAIALTPAPTASTYTIVATPVASGPQANDTTCAVMSINNANTKLATSSGGVSETSTCWNN